MVSPTISLKRHGEDYGPKARFIPAWAKGPVFVFSAPTRIAAGARDLSRRNVSTAQTRPQNSKASFAHQHPCGLKSALLRSRGNLAEHIPGRRPPLRFQALALAPPPVLVVNWGDMTTPPTPSQSAEDYLERIHELIEEKGYARVVDIATSLQVKQASVTSMVQKLGELGYLNYEKYRGLVLTEKGKRVACNIQKRHETLSRFFSLFGLDSETQKQDIEGIEHYLSADTVQILADLACFFENNPEMLKQFLKSRRLPK